MGLFDKFKKALGGGAKSPPIESSIKGPSMVLKEAGVDPTGLSFDFADDRHLTVSGTVPDEETRTRVLQALEAMPHVNGVEDRLDLPEPEQEIDIFAAVEETAPEIDEEITLETPTEEATAEDPAEEAGSADAPAERSEAAPRSYTVQSGDTLSKIAQEFYGDASKYPVIFDANTPMLEDPDTIFPGQELVIPNLPDED